MSARRRKRFGSTLMQPQTQLPVESGEQQLALQPMPTLPLFPAESEGEGDPMQEATDPAANIPINERDKHDERWTWAEFSASNIGANRENQHLGKEELSNSSESTNGSNRLHSSGSRGSEERNQLLRKMTELEKQQGYLERDILHLKANRPAVENEKERLHNDWRYCIERFYDDNHARHGPQNLGARATWLKNRWMGKGRELGRLQAKLDVKGDRLDDVSSEPRSERCRWASRTHG
ncbi:hypothetical protein EJ08DRAFT_7886 [Tothia fuscella]|uniref:Uncharacterized protein n=1 Tax=Tothia fuscella TaxID=1048955 RepID=A0A9P4P4Y8_9PEZI|nr:hypothetical protein EJ08DRAFT_7886 [Tothia fuscella]